MASVVDSIRSVYQDNYSLLKLGIFSYVIYLTYSLIIPSQPGNPMNLLFIIIIIYLYLGFCTIIMNNRINQKIETLPLIDPIKFVTTATKATILFLPFSIIGFFVVSLVVGLFNFEGLPQLIAIWLIRYFIFSFAITALINFAEKFDIKDGLHPSKILAGVADVLVYTLLCSIILAILSIFIVFPTLYLVYNFFKIGPLFYYICVFFTTLNLAIYADYWGQLHFDIESKNNYY
ncbi:MAG: hypothetical protein KHX03_00260 [Clostridium sp.]|nr:hypothetical protein [Clostridium sp.]